jgi:DNA invertase Pin-like site-specific DNA recombinase
VGDRSACDPEIEGFISPEVQRQRIQVWADANGVEILAWWEELDPSGGKRERPLFQKALSRCERGETGGIVVAKLDRFAARRLMRWSRSSV